MGHVTAKLRIDRALALACALGSAAVLGGCGGVEFQGKVFDYMGVSGDRQEADVRMTERPPLLVPPTLDALPPPGSVTAPATARADWPEDPEVVRKRVAADQKAKQAELEAKVDPTNPYAGKPNLIDKLLGGSETKEEPVANLPEPDASDRVDTETVAAQSQPKALTPHVPQAPLPERPVEGPGVSGAYEGMSSPSGNQANW